MYTPDPIDLSDIIIPAEIEAFVERLAENVHENWASARIEEGWVYGEHYDSILKTHPSLIPYNSLPESEKEYDRNTALQTIKLLMKEGFEIKHKEKNNE